METDSLYELFQSTPPREGGDCHGDGQSYGGVYFNPRPPARGATLPALRFDLGVVISIHAPPRGGRPAEILLGKIAYAFQSTPPREGGDSYKSDNYNANGLFQSTPPREGGDQVDDRTGHDQPEFQSTPPREGGDSKDAQFYLRIFGK